MHDEFPLALFLPLASDVNKFSLLRREAGHSPWGISSDWVLAKFPSALQPTRQ